MISAPSICRWAGPIIDILLDYVGHVTLCSRLMEHLNSYSDWSVIKDKAGESITDDWSADGQVPSGLTGLCGFLQRLRGRCCSSAGCRFCSGSDADASTGYRCPDLWSASWSTRRGLWRTAPHHRDILIINHWWIHMSSLWNRCFQVFLCLKLIADHFSVPGLFYLH